MGGCYAWGGGGVSICKGNPELWPMCIHIGSGMCQWGCPYSRRAGGQWKTKVQWGPQMDNSFSFRGRDKKIEFIKYWCRRRRIEWSIGWEGVVGVMEVKGGQMKMKYSDPRIPFRSLPLIKGVHSFLTTRYEWESHYCLVSWCLFVVHLPNRINIFLPHLDDWRSRSVPLLFVYRCKSYSSSSYCFLLLVHELIPCQEDRGSGGNLLYLIEEDVININRTECVQGMYSQDKKGFPRIIRIIQNGIEYSCNNNDHWYPFLTLLTFD